MHEQAAGCHLTPGLDETVTGEIGIQPHYAVALDGDVLAYDSYGCVVVEDLATGFQRIIRLESTLEPVRSPVAWSEPTVLAVAGRLLAYRANPPGGEGPAAIVVYDIDSGQTLYRVPVKAPEPSNGTSFALQADGTLVLAESLNCRATVSTVAEPAPRPLGVPACTVYGLAEGRLLFEVGAQRSSETLDWSPLQAPALHGIADLGVGGDLQAAAPVLGGGETAYALHGCWTPAVYRTTLEEPGTPPAPPATCPIHILGGHASLTHGRLTVAIRCPLGCQGEIEASVGPHGQLTAGRGKASRFLTIESFSAAPERPQRSRCCRARKRTARPPGSCGALPPRPVMATAPGCASTLTPGPRPGDRARGRTS